MRRKASQSFLIVFEVLQLTAPNWLVVFRTLQPDQVAARSTGIADTNPCHHQVKCRYCDVVRYGLGRSYAFVITGLGPFADAPKLVACESGQFPTECQVDPRFVGMSGFRKSSMTQFAAKIRGVV